MAKQFPIPEALTKTVISAIKEGWKVGDLTPVEPEVLAPRAIRRWRSFANRGIAVDDREARIRDLARFISFGGECKLYRAAAERIAAALESAGL